MTHDADTIDEQNEIADDIAVAGGVLADFLHNAPASLIRSACRRIKGDYNGLMEATATMHAKLAERAELLDEPTPGDDDALEFPDQPWPDYFEPAPGFKVEADEHGGWNLLADSADGTTWFQGSSSSDEARELLEAFQTDGGGGDWQDLSE